MPRLITGVNLTHLTVRGRPARIHRSCGRDARAPKTRIPAIKRAIVLKGCLGEWIALENFSSSYRSSVFPTIEIPPVELKYEEELGVSTGPKKTVAEHVRHFSKVMDKHLPLSWQFGLDGSRCFKDNQLHFKIYQDLIASAHASRHLAIPVTGLERSAACQHAVQELLQSRDGKLILRTRIIELLLWFRLFDYPFRFLDCLRLRSIPL